MRLHPRDLRTHTLILLDHDGLEIARVLGIAALSWIGGLLWVVFIFSAAQRIFNNNRRTLAEAQECLEQLEARHAD